VPVPDQSKEPVQQSYAKVVMLLDSIANKDESLSGVTAAEKRAALLRDPTRCGLVKAVHRPSGRVEWVAPKQKAAFETHGAKVFAKRAKRAKLTTKAEHSSSSSKVERPSSKAASSGSQRTSLDLDADLSELRSVLQAVPQLGDKLRETYCVALAKDGFDSAMAVAAMQPSQWPEAIRKGHRDRIRKAAAQYDQGACCKCLQ